MHNGIDSQDSALPGARMRRSKARRVVAGVLAVVVAAIMLVVLPPLINLNRYQRRIALNIGNSLGRPVHLGRISLNMLPVPGFTLEDFVVGENPEFGFEPILRANKVEVTLRASSLWRGRVEFSTISLTDPSINLVRSAQGKFNIESILLHASRIDAAPTAQEHASAAPRFPYIEATGGRINLKLGDEKTPFSFTEAAFALWLPSPQEWNIRLTAKPVRTDTNAADTGTFHLDGTLRAADQLATLPIDLSGQWTNLPLGEASKIFTGSDVGWRGETTLKFHVLGTAGNADVSTQLRVASVRREEFVPPLPLDVDLACNTHATNFFQSIEGLQCKAPFGGGEFVFTGEIPELGSPHSITGEVSLNSVDTQALATLSRILSHRIDPALSVTGAISGRISIGASINPSINSEIGPQRISAPQLVFATPSGPIAIATAVVLDRTIPVSARKKRGANASPAPESFRLTLLPAQLDLGGGQSPATIDGHFEASGYVLHLRGSVLPQRLALLAKALPQFGDGLQEWLEENDGVLEPRRIDVTTMHGWFGKPAPEATETLPTSRR